MRLDLKILCLFSCGAPLLAYSQESAPPRAHRANDAALIQAVAHASEQNRLAFRYGDIHFTYTIGASNTIEEASSGRLSHPMVADGRYTFLDDKRRVECVIRLDDELADEQSTAPGQIRKSGLSFIELSSNVGQIVDWISPSRNKGERVHQLQFYAKGVDIAPPIEFPLGLGKEDEQRDALGVKLQKVLKGGGTIKEVRSNSEFEGARTTRITVDLERGGSTYWVDLEHGAIPLKSEFTWAGSSGSRTHVTLLQDIRGTSKGWLPFLVVWRNASGLVHRLQITDADFENLPEPSVFQIELLWEQRLFDSQKAIMYAPRRVWRLDDLPPNGSREITKLGNVPPKPKRAELPGEREESWPDWLIWGAPLGVAVCVLTFLMILRRRHA